MEHFIACQQIALSGPFPVIVNIPTPRSYRVLRVYVVADTDVTNRVMLTFEFYGCETTNDGMASICVQD